MQKVLWKNLEGPKWSLEGPHKQTKTDYVHYLIISKSDKKTESRQTQNPVGIPNGPHLDPRGTHIYIRVLLRLEFQVAHPILNTTLATEQKQPFKVIFVSSQLWNQLRKNGHKFSEEVP